MRHTFESSLPALPAFRSVDVDPARELKSGSRITAGHRSSRLRNAMVCLQVSIAVVLLIGAGLLIHSLKRQMTVDLGFRTEGLLTAESSAAYLRITSPGYFDAMGMTIVSGRDLTERDESGKPLVAVVNERIARDWYPEMNPIGQGLMIMQNGNPVEYEIVRVVADARLVRPDRQPYRAMYLSLYQVPITNTRLVVRTAADPTELVPAVRDILREIDNQIIFANQQTVAAGHLPRCLSLPDRDCPDGLPHPGLAGLGCRSGLHSARGVRAMKRVPPASRI